MVSVNSGVSTLRVPSTVTAMKVMHWRMIIVSVEVKRFIIPYSGKFSRGPNFHDFCDLRPKHENKKCEIRKFEHVNF